ncbi:hypothetical protein SDC9_124977 [bioreactor metagenome]|uniref:Uncharacterized protein n=1 Tax=bioreactor metagenome TaxID=1076179 RepID=A0A645CM44_9ZZZZ
MPAANTTASRIGTLSIEVAYATGISEISTSLTMLLATMIHTGLPRSTYAPASRPKTTIGSQPAADSRPIVVLDAPSCCTATSGTATSVTCVPTSDTLSAPPRATRTACLLAILNAPYRPRMRPDQPCVSPLQYVRLIDRRGVTLAASEVLHGRVGARC